jgi:hypothetical protein
MGAYVKAFAAIVVSAIGALTVALGTGATDFEDISTQGWLIAGGAVLASGGLVWFTENGPAAPIIKAIMGGLTAAVASATIALDDDVFTRAEQLTAVGAFVVGLGIVYQLKNTPAGKPVTSG